MTRNTTLGAALLVAASSAANAGGFDLTGQRLEDLFQPGRYASVAIVAFSPDVSGTTGPGLTPLGPSPQLDTGDTIKSVLDYNFVYKDDINDQWSYYVSLGQPFARDSTYEQGFFNGASASLDVQALTALVRYKFTDRISVYGGPRLYRAGGEVNSPSPFVPNTVNLDADYAGAFVIGAAYEIPEYFARVSLTYNSKADLDMDTTSGGTPFGNGNTESTIPQSVNLSAQMPVSRQTLLFGDVRWVDWSETRVNPGGTVDDGPFGISDIVFLENSTTYRLGVAHRFNDKFTGILGISYEPGDDEALNGLFNTVDGFVGYSIGGVYSPNEKVDIRLSVSYVDLGDRSGITAFGLPGSFTDNSAYSVGLKVGYKF